MDEKRRLFNQQMNEWVSRQGLWFQLRHAADGQSILSRMMRLLLRFSILLFILALSFWGYLVYRIDKKDFAEKLQTQVETCFHGQDCKIGGVKKHRNTATISSLEMKGTDDSFFEKFQARILEMNMGLTDGMFGVWNAGGITIDYLDIDLKAGARNDLVASRSYQALFEKHPKFQFDWIESKKTNFKWGYSPRNRGMIEDSFMMATYENNVWRLEFRGGTFSQNWIKHFKISHLVVLCDQNGVHIKEGELLAGKGSLTFNIEMGSGGQPEASGSVVLDSIPVKSILPYRYSDWIDGKISGEGTVSGSTNSQDGILLDLNITLKEGDTLIVRDSLPILSALSVVDVYNSYRKVVFDRGGMHVQTGRNRMKVDRINMKAQDLVYLTGEFEVRPPTYKEIAKSLEIKDVQRVQDVIEKNWKFEDDILKVMDSTTSLADAAREIRDVVSENMKRESLGMMDMLTPSILAEKNKRRFEGMVKIGLKHDAFDNSPRLKKKYPFDPKTARIWIQVPLKGVLHELTLKQAKEFYVLGRKLK